MTPVPLVPTQTTKYLLERPEATTRYKTQAWKNPKTMAKARPLLVILDLNGTLVYRPSREVGSDFISRPNVDEFLHYLLTNHHVMIWSSAKSYNVKSMCDRLFYPEQRDKLVAIWDRNHLRLPRHLVKEKVQVYKQLSWIWKDRAIQGKNPDNVEPWSQENTVLIDDSTEKAASEPFNIVKVEEFEGKEEQMNVDVLGQVVKYLDMLKSEQDVSAYMRWKPFEYDKKVSFDWMSIVNDMH